MFKSTTPNLKPYRNLGNLADGIYTGTVTKVIDNGEKEFLEFRIEQPEYVLCHRRFYNTDASVDALNRIFALYGLTGEAGDAFVGVSMTITKISDRYNYANSNGEILELAAEKKSTIEKNVVDF